VQDVFGAASARQVVRGPRQSLQDRSYRHRIADPLRDLVGDVAGFEVRKDEYVGVSAKRGIRRL